MAHPVSGQHVKPRCLHQPTRKQGVDTNDMEHVFLLLVYLGTGEFRNLASGDMYFRSINECNYFAEKSAKRYGNYQYSAYLDPKDRVTAYCVPKYVNPDNVRIY